LDRAALKEQGWRRHSVISVKNDCLIQIVSELPSNIQALSALEGAIAIISTYDCAVISDDFDSEPWVQLLIAFPVQLNKAFSSCRHPRKLHFLIEHSSEEVSYEVNAVGICQIDRKLLCSIEPDPDFSISEEEKKNLNTWISERFRQETWPDEFNSDIRPAQKRLKKLYQRYNDFISGIYLQLQDYRELEDEKYRISAILALEKGKERALLKETRARIKELKDKGIDEVCGYIEHDIIRAFGDTVEFIDDPTSTTGKSVAIISEDSLTIYQLKTHHLFSPLSLSLEDEAAPEPIDVSPAKTLD
jgi:hypothetical protein